MGENMKLDDLDEESKKKLKEEVLKEIKKEEKVTSKEVVKDAVKEVNREKAEAEENIKWMNICFVSTGVLLLATLIAFLCKEIYWGIGLAVLSVLNVLFIVYRKKMPDVLFIILSIIQGVLFASVGVLFVILNLL